MNPKITVGKIVHFVMKKNIHRAAIILNVKDNEICDLFVFSMPNEGGFFLKLDCWHSEEEMDVLETWHWMEE